ncbi:MAG: RNA polymerase sigma factor [Clostridia bacterium]|nr:RNA polymerase sigma factor [Clostridia bacterium]
MNLYQDDISSETALLFQKMYQTYANDVLRKINKILKDKDDAQDVAQETWIYILEHIDIFQGKSERSVKAYIFSVAKNKAIDSVRKKRREEKILCEFDDADVADESEMFELCADQSDESVWKCIIKLGEPYTSVLTYYYLHHHTLKEISKMMKLNESTVGSRLTRGRKKLIALLKKEGYYE